MRLNTNGDIFPEGIYQFRVATIPEETSVKGYTAWQWSFEVDTDEGVLTYNERFMVWTLAPLLRGLAFKEIIPGEFDFEPTEALGRRFKATIAHVTLEKGASAGKVVARMKDITPELEARTMNRAAMTAQAPAGSVKDVPF